ncbi:hypothetical protein LPJ59_006524 [Coemansia sp. RSA 2399]|nr:hypothetical protein LPJ59_006524 [Coemansia sp. RSA 2399]
MSMLLHGSASRTPTTTSSSTDLPQETSRSNRTQQTKHLQFYDDTASLGAVAHACKRTHMSDNYETTALCHATPLYSATRQLEDRSLVLSQDPNSVTSMIAISTVLIFATFVTF